MNIGGLIASAASGLSKGYGEVAKGNLEDQRKRSLSEQLAEIETQKQLQIEAARTEGQIRANDAKATRELADIPKKAEAENKASVDAIIANAANPNYIKGVKDLTKAKETSKDVVELDEINARTEKLKLEKTILELGKGSKTYSDVVAAAGHASQQSRVYMTMADNADEPDEKARYLALANDLGQYVADTLMAVRDKRLPSDKTTDTAAPKPSGMKDSKGNDIFLDSNGNPVRKRK